MILIAINIAMKIQHPKKAPSTLIKRVEKIKAQLKAGTAKIRKTERYGYATIALESMNELCC